MPFDFFKIHSFFGYPLFSKNISEIKPCFYLINYHYDILIKNIYKKDTKKSGNKTDIKSVNFVIFTFLSIHFQIRLL